MGRKGSQKWLQRLVNEKPCLLNNHLMTAGVVVPNEAVTWLSPLADDGYAEYRDERFLQRLEVELIKRPLTTFWPPRGPQWDGLGRTANGRLLLVEAKSHIGELNSQSKASPKSAAILRQSLQEVQRALGVATKPDWSQVYYQYANRLAHLWLLREANDLPAHLLFIYFVGDEEMRGSRTKEEWELAIAKMEASLGIKEHLLQQAAHHIFVDVAQLV